MDILHVIATAGRSMGVSEISRELGLSKSTTHRVCGTLAEGRFLAHDPRTGEYKPGRRLFDITQNLLRRLPFAEACRPVLRRMGSSVRQNAFAASLVDMEELLVCEEVRVENPVQPRSLLGWRAALLEGPGGLLCLGSLPDEDLKPAVRQVLRHPALKRKRSFQEVHSDVQAHRRCPFAVQTDLPEPNLAVVCSLVQGSHGWPVGVLGYCYPMLLRGAVDPDRLGAECAKAAGIPADRLRGSRPADCVAPEPTDNALAEAAVEDAMASEDANEGPEHRP